MGVCYSTEGPKLPLPARRIPQKLSKTLRHAMLHTGGMLCIFSFFNVFLCYAVATCGEPESMLQINLFLILKNRILDAGLIEAEVCIIVICIFPKAFR